MNSELSTERFVDDRTKRPFRCKCKFCFLSFFSSSFDSNSFSFDSNSDYNSDSDFAILFFSCHSNAILNSTTILLAKC